MIIIHLMNDVWDRWSRSVPQKKKFTLNIIMVWLKWETNKNWFSYYFLMHLFRGVWIKSVELLIEIIITYFPHQSHETRQHVINALSKLRINVSTLSSMHIYHIRRHHPQDMRQNSFQNSYILFHDYQHCTSVTYIIAQLIRRGVGNYNIFDASNSQVRLLSLIACIIARQFMTIGTYWSRWCAQCIQLKIFTIE